MVIDTSALIAILLGEPEAEDLAQAIALDSKRLVSAFSALEAAAVIHGRKGPAGLRELDLLLHATGATIVSLDAEQAVLARTAYEKFGKGHHPAALNLGDCCSYALARSCGEPLLFKGTDFTKTDIAAVRAS
jgi:ribonuclease VapC